MKKILLTTIWVCGMFFPCFGQQTAPHSEPGGSSVSDKVADSGTASRISFVSSGVTGIHEFSFWGGYSFQSNKGIWGQTSSAQLSIMGMRYNRKFLRFPGDLLLEYTIELNLMANYSYPEFTREARRATVTGFGLSPFGFQFNWREQHAVQPFIKSAAGFLYMNNPFPDSRGEKFNFTLELGAGLEFQLTPHTSFAFGYKYHHMSNGDLGTINPGIDSNVLYGVFTIY